MLIIFDLDDTLIDTSGSITPIQLERALRKMVEAGLKVDHFDDALRVLRLMDLSSESALQTLRRFLEFVGGDPALLSVGEKIVYGELPPDLAVAELEGASRVLSNLQKAHQLALVSVGKPHQQLLKMKSAGLDSTIFSKIMISETEDKKPSYKEVLEALDMAPAQTVVCGDRVKRDLVPAKELGCRTIQMQWGRGLCPTKDSAAVDFVVRQLTQIQEIIENL